MPNSTDLSKELLDKFILDCGISYNEIETSVELDIVGMIPHKNKTVCWLDSFPEAMRTGQGPTGR